MKPEPSDDELVAIVAAYAIVVRDGRTLAPVPEPAPAWRRAARLEGVGEAGAAARHTKHRARWRASSTP